MKGLVNRKLSPSEIEQLPVIDLDHEDEKQKEAIKRFLLSHHIKFERAHSNNEYIAVVQITNREKQLQHRSAKGSLASLGNKVNRSYASNASMQFDSLNQSGVKTGEDKGLLVPSNFPQKMNENFGSVTSIELKKANAVTPEKLHRKLYETDMSSNPKSLKSSLKAESGLNKKQTKKKPKKMLQSPNENKQSPGSKSRLDSVQRNGIGKNSKTSLNELERSSSPPGAHERETSIEKHGEMQTDEIGQEENQKVLFKEPEGIKKKKRAKTALKTKNSTTAMQGQTPKPVAEDLMEHWSKKLAYYDLQPPVITNKPLNQQKKPEKNIISRPDLFKYDISGRKQILKKPPRKKKSDKTKDKDNAKPEPKIEENDSPLLDQKYEDENPSDSIFQDLQVYLKRKTAEFSASDFLVPTDADGKPVPKEDVPFSEEGHIESVPLVSNQELHDSGYQSSNVRDSEVSLKEKVEGTDSNYPTFRRGSFQKPPEKNEGEQGVESKSIFHESRRGSASLDKVKNEANNDEEEEDELEDEEEEEENWEDELLNKLMGDGKAASANDVSKEGKKAGAKKKKRTKKLNKSEMAEEKSSIMHDKEEDSGFWKYRSAGDRTPKEERIEFLKKKMIDWLNRPNPNFDENDPFERKLKAIADELAMQKGRLLSEELSPIIYSSEPHPSQQNYGRENQSLSGHESGQFASEPRGTAQKNITIQKPSVQLQQPPDRSSEPKKGESSRERMKRLMQSNASSRDPLRSRENSMTSFDSQPKPGENDERAKSFMMSQDELKLNSFIDPASHNSFENDPDGKKRLNNLSPGRDNKDIPVGHDYFKLIFSSQVVKIYPEGDQSIISQQSERQELRSRAESQARINESLPTELSRVEAHEEGVSMRPETMGPVRERGSIVKSSQASINNSVVAQAEEIQLLPPSLNVQLSESINKTPANTPDDSNTSRQPTEQKDAAARFDQPISETSIAMQSNRTSVVYDSQFEFKFESPTPSGRESVDNSRKPSTSPDKGLEMRNSADSFSRKDSPARSEAKSAGDSGSSYIDDIFSMKKTTKGPSRFARLPSKFAQNAEKEADKSAENSIDKSADKGADNKSMASQSSAANLSRFLGEIPLTRGNSNKVPPLKLNKSQDQTDSPHNAQTSSPALKIPVVDKSTDSFPKIQDTGSEKQPGTNEKANTSLKIIIPESNVETKPEVKPEPKPEAKKSSSSVIIIPSLKITPVSKEETKAEPPSQSNSKLSNSPANKSENSSKTVESKNKSVTLEIPQTIDNQGKKDTLAVPQNRRRLTISMTPRNLSSNETKSSFTLSIEIPELHRVKSEKIRSTTHAEALQHAKSQDFTQKNDEKNSKKPEQVASKQRIDLLSEADLEKHYLMIHYRKVCYNIFNTVPNILKPEILQQQYSLSLNEFLQHCKSSSYDELDKYMRFIRRCAKKEFQKLASDFRRLHTKKKDSNDSKAKKKAGTTRTFKF